MAAYFAKYQILVSILLIILFYYYKTKDKSVISIFAVIATLFLGLLIGYLLIPFIPTQSPLLVKTFLLSFVFIFLIIGLLYSVKQKEKIRKEKGTEKVWDFSILVRPSSDNLIFWVILITSNIIILIIT